MHWNIWDGESSFLIPDGLKREDHWLAHETNKIQRQFLRDVKLQFTPSFQVKDCYMKSYPVHSFTAWMKEFRMLGFLQRVQKQEEKLEDFTLEQKALWLGVINSDILSAVEKHSPVVSLKPAPEEKGQASDYVIQRSERGFEGEDYLGVLEYMRSSPRVEEYFHTSDEPHMQKLRARWNYLSTMPKFVQERRSQ